MFRALDVGSTVASPTVIESNGGLGRCLEFRTRSSVLSLFNRRLTPSARRHNVLHSSGLHAKVQLSVVRVHVKPDTMATHDSSERRGIDQV